MEEPYQCWGRRWKSEDASQEHTMAACLVAQLGAGHVVGQRVTRAQAALPSTKHYQARGAREQTLGGRGRMQVRLQAEGRAEVSATELGSAVLRPSGGSTSRNRGPK